MTADAGGRSLKARAMAVLVEGLSRDIEARDNTVIGLLSEAVVALAIDGELAPHRWEAWDVLAPDRGRVQVKTSTGMSIGKKESAAASAARWNGFKPNTRWDVEADLFDDSPKWWADVWVLARVDGLDPWSEDAWSFFVLTREQIQALASQSTRVSVLMARGHQPVSLEGLAAAYGRCRALQMPHGVVGAGPRATGPDVIT